MRPDRRDFQRLRLAKPILAIVDSRNALILDIGVSGALIEHYGVPEIGSRLRLMFRWRSEDVEFETEVRRTTPVRYAGDAPVSHTGVRFIGASDESRFHLRDMMTTFVGRVLAAQRANARGERRGGDEVTLSQLGGARRARSRGWVAYRLRDGTWSREASDSPEQPPDGFTVAAFEAEEELDELCRTFEAADEESRRLIRLVAELSAREGKL